MCRIIFFLLFLFVNKTVVLSQSPAYNEQYRPQFHFSPTSNWMNDPNGMVYYKGEHHLFYQYYPNGNVWGPMHWGHAVSKNMVEWQHLPIALYPDSLGYIFSGSIVVDEKNTSGLGKKNAPVLVAIYTYHLPEGEKANRNDFQYQGIAYSHDMGRTWKKYTNNPVLPNTNGIRDFRDPKVFWHKERNQWVMTLAVKDHVEFWGSSDLLKWKLLSSFGSDLGAHGGVWECPDLFPMKVAANGQEKYVLLVSINPGGPNGGSATQYFTGSFNGKEFVPDAFHQTKKPLWLDYGRDNYAGVTWSNIPVADGRRLFIGWMSNWDYAQVVPTTVWRSAMTLPRSLSLIKTTEGLRLKSEPVQELKLLRGKAVTIKAATESTRFNLSSASHQVQQTEWVIEFEVKDTNTASVYLELTNALNETYRIGCNVKQNQFYSDRTKAGNHSFSEKFATGIHTAERFTKNKRIKLHVFVDASSVELFADEGAVCMSELVFPSQPFNKATLHSEGSKVKLISAVCYPLKRIWK